MRRYLLDTGSAADYIFRRRGMEDRVKNAVLRGDRIGICTPVLGELHAGIELSATKERNWHRLVRALATLVIWPFDEQAAREFGILFAHLRRSGRLMQQVDIQTAAIAITLGNCTVVTKDSDFQAIPDLIVENWVTM